MESFISTDIWYTFNKLVFCVFNNFGSFYYRKNSIKRHNYVIHILSLLYLLMLFYLDLECFFQTVSLSFWLIVLALTTTSYIINKKARSIVISQTQCLKRRFSNKSTAISIKQKSSPTPLNHVEPFISVNANFARLEINWINSFFYFYDLFKFIA